MGFKASIVMEEERVVVAAMAARPDACDVGFFWLNRCWGLRFAESRDLYGQKMDLLL